MSKGALRLNQRDDRFTKQHNLKLLQLKRKCINYECTSNTYTAQQHTNTNDALGDTKTYYTTPHSCDIISLRIHGNILGKLLFITNK